MKHHESSEKQNPLGTESFDSKDFFPNDQGLSPPMDPETMGALRI